MKNLSVVFLSLLLVFSFFGCETGDNPTAPSKDELGQSSDPQPVPEEISEALEEQDGEGINTEYMYETTEGEGDVVWNVDTSQSAPSHIPGIGEHAGELKFLDIDIIFKDPYFYTEEGYAGYYIGLPMNYEIKIKNTGNRAYKHLDVVSIQEYYETGTCDRWWYPYPREAEYAKGSPLPGDSMQYWRNVEIGKNETITLKGEYTAPYSTCAGLDQIHLIIQHTNNGALHAATMYYNPEAAVYCPPPPE